MPIKVSYTDDKGNAIADPDAAPLTNEDRILWNKMRYEGFQRGIYENDLETPKGKKLLDDFGIDQDKLPAYRQDMIARSKRQSQPGALDEVGPGFSSMDLHVDPQILAQAKTPRMGYVTYIAQRGDEPPKDYGADIDAFISDQNKQKAERDAEYKGMDNPTPNQDVWQSPTVVNGQLVQPAGFAEPAVDSTPTVATPDTRFPTRDPITGRVTPAAQPVPDDNE